jgi:electron transfer flavoprotein alpha subunit
MVTILTLCFAFGKALSRSDLEVVVGARSLAGQMPDGRVQTLLIGPSAAVYSDALIHQGIDQLFVIEDGRLQPHQTDRLLATVEKFVQDWAADVILLPHDNLGSEIGARLAYRLKTGIVTDCTGFKVKTHLHNEGLTIQWFKPVYGGKATAHMVTGGGPKIATLRARAFDPLPPEDGRQGTVECIKIDIEAPAAVRLVERIQEEPEGVSLDQAAIVIGGGRGIGSAEGFAALEQLAGVLGAAVGGSRPAADLGWIPHSRLLGQTGKIIAPDLYLAFGISGAPQHMAGAGASKTIVAINNDPDGPIFRVANLGLVETWQDVVPAMTAACRELTEE